MREPNTNPDGLDGFRLAPVVAALLALALVVSLTGCTPTGGADLRKILATWDDVCHTGRGALVVAAQITREPVDAGDASASAESDASEGGAP